MRHTISVLVENRFGVLARVAGLFSGRGFNIESLNVSPTQDENISKMTIVTSGEDTVLEQIDKQLNKLVEVIKVTDLTGSGYVARELMLIKVKTSAETRSDIIQIANIFNARILDVHHEAVLMEVTGDAEELDSFVNLMQKFGIIELARTGKLALARSPEATEKLDLEPDAQRWQEAASE